MKTNLLSVVLAAALASSPFVAGAVHAQAAATPAQGSASQMVQDSSSRILSTLSTRHAEFQKSPAALNAYVNSEFNTLFDREYAARLVLGLHGRGASDADVSDFADALTQNLIKRYGTALLDFNPNSQIKVKVKGETALPGGRGVRVSTEIPRNGGDPVPVDYFVRNNGGQWKVFDVMVEGISYVQTFKNQFDAPLQHETIPQVAADLRAGKLQASSDNNGK